MESKKLKICFICPGYYPVNSGYSNATTNFTNALKDYLKDKVDITVITFVQKGEGGIEILENGIKVYRFAHVKSPLTNIITSIFLSSKISKIIKKSNIDLLFFETAEWGILTKKIIKKTKKPAILRIHACTETELAIFGGTIKNFYGRYICNKGIKIVKNIASTSRYHIDFIINHYFKKKIKEIDEHEFFVIPNIVMKRDKKISHRSLDLPKDKKIFLQLGRMSESGLSQKGFEDSIKAFYALKKESLLLAKKALVIFIGDGPERERLKNLSKRLGLKENIIFIKKTTHEETLNYINSCDVILHPARYEGMSMFLLETISMGKPILTTTAGAIPSMVSHKKNGWMVAPYDYKGIKKIMEEIIEGKYDLKKMGKESSKVYTKKFSPDKIIKDFLVISEYLLNKEK